MTDRTESTMSIIAALLVVFTAMLDPRVSAGPAAVLLVAFAFYKWRSSHKAGA